MSLQNIPPVTIEIDIPDLVIGEVTLKRKATLFTMTYNQAIKYLALSWIVSYPDVDSAKGISSYTKESIADNTTMVDVNTGAVLTPDEEGNYAGDYIGQYDWFNLMAETQQIKVHDLIRAYGASATWN